MSIQRRPPTEVLEAVVDEASDNPTSLRHLSLTCTTLLPRSRLHLFSGLFIRTVQQLEASREFLDSCPWLPPLVRKISLSVTIPEVYHRPNIRLLDVVSVHLLTRLPNLRAWTMETADSVLHILEPSLSLHLSALRCYRIYGGHIRSLELSRIRFRSKSHFRGLVLAFTGLDSLACDHISFYSRAQRPVIAVTVATKIRPLPISTLNICTSMDRWALEYLLACSTSKLKHLTIRLRVEDLSSRFLKRLEQLLTQLPSLSSLVLVMSLCGRNIVVDENLSTTIRFATTVLKHINRDYLTDIRVEFKANPLANLGASIAGASASLSACQQLENALLTFPKAAVLVHDTVHKRTAGRAKFWAPIIRRAFPRLDDRGLLTLEFKPSKEEDAPDPVGHERRVTCIVVSHDSTRAVTSSEDGTIIVWDIAEGVVLHEWVAHKGWPVAALALSPDSIRLASSGGYGLAVWGIDSDPALKAAKLEEHEQFVKACTWSPNGTLIASASRKGAVRIWDGHTYEERDYVPACLNFECHQIPDSFQFSPNSSYIAWITDDMNCCIWRPFMGKWPKTLPLYPKDGNITTTVLSFDPESRRIATAHGNVYRNPDACVVRIWDAATGSPVAVLTGHSKTVRSISFSPDGRSLLSVADDVSMWIWDCGTWSGNQTDGFKDSESPIRHVQWCVRHNGKYLATLSAKGLVHLWRTSDGECVATFDARDTFINCIEFSPNGQFLVSGHGNGVVRIHCLSRFITE